MANQIFRITSFKQNICLDPEFDEQINKIQKHFDEKTYLKRVEELTLSILTQHKLFAKQIDELKEKYIFMQGSLSLLSQIYMEDSHKSSLGMLDLYGNAAKMFGNQSILMNEILNSLATLINDHFDYQTAV